MNRQFENQPSEYASNIVVTQVGKNDIRYDTYLYIENFWWKWIKVSILGSYFHLRLGRIFRFHFRFKFRFRVYNLKCCIFIFYPIHFSKNFLLIVFLGDISVFTFLSYYFRSFFENFKYFNPCHIPAAKSIFQ